MTETQKTAAAKASDAKTVSPGEKIAEAQTNLARSLQEGCLAKHMKHNEASVEFARASQQLELDTAQRATEAYNQYVKAAQDAANADNPTQRLTEAYQNYVGTMQGLQEDTGRRWQEAYDEFNNRATQAASEEQKQVRQYYVDYLKSIQRLWASIDVETLVP